MGERSDALLRPGGRAGEAPPSPDGGSGATADGALADRAAAAVSALPARRQEVFRLVRRHGLSYEEVARVLEMPLETVAEHMSLALASLRAALASREDAAGTSRITDPDPERRAP